MRLVGIGLVVGSVFMAGCNAILGVQELPYSPDADAADASSDAQADVGTPSAPIEGGSVDSTVPDAPLPSDDSGVDATQSESDASDASDSSMSGDTGPGNPCATDNGGCPAESTCSTGDAGGVSCTCAAGYTGSGAGAGTVCTPVDSCLTNHGGCDPNAACAVTGPGTNSCTCNPNYTGNGTTCIGVNGCATNNGGCASTAQCTSPDAGAVVCACNTGYSGNGFTCTAINECTATPNGGCSANATCTPTGPGTSTCACNTGYSGSGTTCTAIDNCTAGTSGCSANATCTDTGPGTNTCACNTGYSGNGTTCTAIDNCTAGTSGCSANATCTDTGPGTSTCACKTGYTGNGMTCTAIDNCTAGTSGCSANATCTDTGPGTNTCACNTGYTGNGTTCTAIDNCTAGTGGCSANATCTDTGPGTNTCTCNAGYTGNGTTCTALETLTFSMPFIGSASASVSTSPASSINCTGACSTSAQFAMGTVVTLTANVAAGNIFYWSGACTGSSTTCAVTLNVAATVKLTVSHNNFMFLSSQATSSGDFGGLAGGDQLCQSYASGAGLPGTYQALLATGTTNLTSRLTAAGARGWVRVDGQPFADEPSDLTSGALRTPAMLTESGVIVYQGSAWTGASATGTPSGADCTGFTSSTATSGGECGTNYETESGFYFGGNEACSVDYQHLYCFGTTLSNPLVVTKTPGRIAFVSKALFDTSQGLSGGTPNVTTGSADVLCQTEAAAAGLSGTYLALLATTAASAASRFTYASGLPWVRPDGMPLAATAASFMASSTYPLLTSLNEHADGTYADNAGSARTGAFSYPDANAPSAPLTSAASSLTDTCNDWKTASTANTGSIGLHEALYTNFFAQTSAAACGATYPVYCLQE